MNVATAEAMQGPPEKHLARRQQYFTYILEEIIYHAYQRAAALRRLPSENYDRLCKVTAPDVSTKDNQLFAEASTRIATAMQALESLLQSNITLKFKALVTDMVLKFAGERPEEKAVQQLIKQPSARSDSPYF